MTIGVEAVPEIVTGAAATIVIVEGTAVLRGTGAVPDGVVAAEAEADLLRNVPGRDRRLSTR